MKIEYLEEFEQIKKYTDRLNNYRLREQMVIKYSWAIPNELAIKTIAKYSPIIEIGAGTGYWAKLLIDYGVKIICFDKYLIDNPYRHKIQYVPIYNGDHSVLNKFSIKTNLFLSWAPYNDPMAFDCLKSFKGNYLIYIGESCYGCNANEQFFDELFNNWKKIESIDIPQWYGLHDSLSIYKRIKRRRLIKWKRITNQIVKEKTNQINQLVEMKEGLKEKWNIVNNFILTGN